MSAIGTRGGRRASRSLIGTWLLVVLSVVSWRPDTLFTGGLDAVVVAKAAVAFTAFICAVSIYSRARVRARVGVRTALLLLVVVGLSCVGALATSDFMPSAVLAIRLVLLAATVYVLASCASPTEVLTTLFIAMGILTLVGAVTGLPEFLSDGRLPSGVPAMKPNELAGLAAPPLLAVSIEIARTGLTSRKAALLLTFAAILLATGSRTTLIVVAIAMVLAVALAWPVPHSTGIALILLVPVTYATIAFTDVVSEVAIRGQDADQLITLSSRTIAWQAVFSVPMDTWHKWIGIGLAVKTVEVDQRWWDVQFLDSSWVSILSQAGIIGLIAVGIWVLFTLKDSLKSPDLRVLTLPLLTLLLLRSALENGLIESSAIFTLFFLISIVLERGHRFPFVHERAVHYPLAAAPLPNPPETAPSTITQAR
ncbi:hypothetical protein A20C1_09249 [marine actinobacterium PHSC20C1]|nr:hypothetical protein A20C1_09249 [marine actinobacterium PHSC20C1]